MFKAGILKVHSFAVPVIVVGNISVGGTGKTPIVRAVVKRCLASGKKPGIVSRGYGATVAKAPRQIDSNTPVEHSGDEPLLLARETGVPVCICTDRSAAVNWLIANNDVDVVISDDGMQHYAMCRNLELAVIDGQRMFGNGWLLPAGPLRESPGRLREVDIIAVQQIKDASDAHKQQVLSAVNVATGGLALTQSTATNSPPNERPAAGHFYLDIEKLQNLADQQYVEIATFHGQRVHAVAGVGNPDRFFTSLRNLEMDVIEHAMPDHHRYTAQDINFDDQYPILITSKDAVKIATLNVNLSRVYEVSVTAKFDSKLDHAIDKMIADII